MERQYIAIDLKSFYASQECVDRGLDPLNTNLVVADLSRTEKTICLAVSPSLKKAGVPGRPRLFEVVEQVGLVNAMRRFRAPGKKFSGSSYIASELENDPSLELSYIVAPPRMARYIEVSAQVYGVYLKYIAPEDIHVYSIDEVFIDATPYLKTYHQTPRQLAQTMILDVLKTTGITATAGVGTNLFLCKAAMDIVAKHIPADENGVRIAELTERSFRQQLWDHRPLTDFWRVGPGYAKKLQQRGLFTMGDIARCSIENEDLLYRLFGVNAELLIDHAWGWEGCTMADIKAYKPTARSMGSGQVLHCAYDFTKARLVLREMTDQLILELVDKGLVCDQMVLTVGYDIQSLAPGHSYRREVVTDHYGRSIPKHAHGSVNLGGCSSSTRRITQAVMDLFDRIADPCLLVRRLNIVANHVVPESSLPPPNQALQLDLFTDPALQEQQAARQQAEISREKRRQTAILSIRKKYGKNAILKGMNYFEGATAIDRNRQIGGHKA